jgi:hypothetical protein
LKRIWKMEKSDFRKIQTLGSKFINALDDACMLGYAWAYAEQESSMRRFAEVGLKSVSRARTGGKRSGESRRREADQTWKPHALLLAQNARRDNPTLSREKVAEAIQETWRLHIDVPAHSTLRNFIAELEKQGKLDRKAKREIR